MQKEVKIIKENKNKINDNFVKYPRDLIYMKNLDSKRIGVYTYFIINKTLYNEVNLSLENIIKFCGYKSNRNSGKINTQIIGLLDTFEGLEYFKLLSGYYKGNYLCKIQLNEDKLDITNNYGYITSAELKLLYNNNTNKTLYSNLILILAYIRVNKLRRSYNQQYSPEKKPEFFYRQIKSISEDIGLSERMISKCIKVLNDLDIIVSESMPRYMDKNDNWHTDVTLFVDKNDNWEQELSWGKQFLFNNRQLSDEDGQS